MKFYLRTRNIIVAALVTAVVILGGVLMQSNFIVTILAALAGGFVILTAKYLGNDTHAEVNATKS